MLKLIYSNYVTANILPRFHPLAFRFFEIEESFSHYFILRQASRERFNKRKDRETEIPLGIRYKIGG